MKAKEYFKEKKGISVTAAWRLKAKYTAVDLVRFADLYYQAKSKEEAEENYKKAVRYLDGLGDGFGLAAEEYTSLRIASGKEKE